MLKGEGENIGRNYAKNNHDNVNCQILIGGNHEDGSQCSCSKFHHHTFQGHTFFLPPEIPDKSESELLFSSKFEFLEANQRHLNVQGFQSGPVPGTFTRLRSCIVPTEITEPPKISGGQNHKYDGR